MSEDKYNVNHPEYIEGFDDGYEQGKQFGSVTTLRDALSIMKLRLTFLERTNKGNKAEIEKLKAFLEYQRELHSDA